MSCLHNWACQQKISKTARFSLFLFYFSNLTYVHLLVEFNWSAEPYLSTEKSGKWAYTPVDEHGYWEHNKQCLPQTHEHMCALKYGGNTLYKV